MLSRYDPFSNMLSLRNVMDQLFAQSLVNPSTGEQVAPMNICETKDGYQIDVALPGVHPEDIDVIVEQNTITVKGQFSQHTHYPQQNEQQGQHDGQQGQTQSEQAHNWLAQEIRSGSFQRSVTLPKIIDTNNIHTNFEHGILSIEAPFSQSSRPRHINIGNGHNQTKEVPAEAQSH